MTGKVHGTLLYRVLLLGHPGAPEVGGDLAAAPLLSFGGDYLGCTPICFMSVSESKYWRLDLILFPSKV